MNWIRRAVCVLVLLANEALARVPDLWNVPVCFAPFWGRKGELVELKDKLAKGPVVVTGLSGVGKSYFTFSYARQNASKYRVVWVFDASQGMDNQMITFANKLYALEHKGKSGTFTRHEDASHYVKTLLRTCAFSWCLIFDGSMSFAAVKDALPETFGAKDKHVVITRLAGRGGEGVLRLEALSDKEAHAFLTHYLKDAAHADIAALARLLENHPLAMLQAAAYINATPGMGIPAYIAFFSKNKKAYFDAEKKALHGQELLSTAIRMSVDKLKETSPQDYTVLVALCLMNTSELDAHLIEKTYISHTHGDMGGFGQIQDVALISPLRKGAYKIHNYVRDVVLMSADKDTLKAAADLDAKTMLALFPEKIEDCVSVFEKNPALVEHMKALMTHMDLMPADEAFAAGLRLFYYTYYFQRDYPYAHELSLELSHVEKSGKITNQLLIANFHNANAWMTFRDQGMEASIQELLKAKAAFEKLDPQLVRSELVMLYGNNLGFNYHWQGNLQKVEECLKDAQRLQSGHTDVMGVTIVECLSIVLAQDKGQNENALATLNKLIALVEKDETENKVAGHYLKSLKACSLLKMAEMKGYEGDTNAAKHLREEALRISEDAYEHALKSSDGRDDTDIVARVLLYLSQAQSSLGQAKIAEENAKRAIAIFDRELMGTHKNRRQGVAYIALGDALTGQGKHEEAYAAYKKAEDIFTKISTHLAFDDMSEVWTRLVANAIIRDDTNTMDRCQRLHQAHFDELHPRYLEIARLITSA